MKAGDRFTLDCTVTPEIYNGFIAMFGDRNPLHVDGDFATSKGFDGPVMHGNILGGFLSRLVGEELPRKDVIIQSETLSFRLPVYLGDTLQLTATVDEVYESVNTAELKFEFRNARSKRVATGTILVGFLA